MSSLTQTLTQLNAQISSQSTDAAYFRPNPGGQERFNKTQARVIILSGGNSSGKTYTGLMKCAHHIIPEKDTEGNNTGFTIHPHRRIRLKPGGIEGWISSWSEKTQRSNMKPLIDKILGPYEKSQKVVGGVRQESIFDTGRIIYKWQTQGVDGYKGDKVDFAHLDEPHKPIIFNETKSRLIARKGTMWNTATFVSGDQYTDLQLSDIMWMEEEIIAPYLRDPDKFLPFMEVIFVSTEENKDHIDMQFVESIFAGLSLEERTTRLTGHILSHLDRCCFSEDRLSVISEYHRNHPDEAAPRYCDLEYENGDVIPAERSIKYFPTKPKGEFIVKIWRMPVTSVAGVIPPEYFIGVDAAEGKHGGDYTAVSVIRGDTGEEVAALHGHISEIELARQLYLLGLLYRGQGDKLPMLGIEVNNIGKTTISYLINGNKDLDIPKYGVGRLYHRPRPGDMERGVSFIGTEPGWLTTHRSRHYLITAMRRIIIDACEMIDRDDYCPIKDVDFITEARGFVLNKNGRYEGRFGVTHDDRIFARAIAEMVKDQYGRKSSPVLTKKDESDDFYRVDLVTGQITFNIMHARQKAAAAKRIYL